ncbi:MAG: tetratricopeptide repeat protein [Rhodospirillales bacterium]|nr:tetratricopeptide repeat protein [Rhodospirillales bacterium]
MCKALLRRSSTRHVPRRFLAVVTASLLAWPLAATAQAPDVGPSGCVANCGTGGGSSGRRGGGRSSSGGSYNPYAGAAATAFGAFLKGFMSGMSPSNRATALNNKGVDAKKSGDLESAVRYYEAALQLTPGDRVIEDNFSTALNDLAIRMERNENYDNAVAYFRRASQYNPGSKVIRENLERAISRRGYARERLRKKAEEKRKMEAALGRIDQKLASFSKDLDLSDQSEAGLQLLEFDEPKKNNPQIAEAKARVGARLDEVEKKIIKALGGESAWDGGRGGTLDSPAQPVRMGEARYDKADPVSTAAIDPKQAVPITAPNAPTGVLGSGISETDKKKNAEASISISSYLASKGDYEGALKHLEKARHAQPRDSGLKQAAAYVKGMKAAKALTGGGGKTNSPSPKADIVLDALSAGEGDWTASLRYLEGMKYKAPANPYVREALIYTRGVYAYQRSRGFKDPYTVEEAKVSELQFPPQSVLDEPSEAEIMELFTNDPLPPWPQHIQDKIDAKEIMDMIANDPLPPRPQDIKGRLSTKEMLEMIAEEQQPQPTGKKMMEQKITMMSHKGLDAVGREDFATAYKIFSALHKQRPNDANIRDVMNYTEGLYHAQQGKKK